MLRSTSLRLLLVACVVPAFVTAPTARAQTAPPPEAEQIAAAVLPLPEAMRAQATVLGYRPAGAALVVLREGTNGMHCLADDPSDDRFHVACYHASLEPFMARGRELRAQGVVGTAVDSVRYAEVAAGTIVMPTTGALYQMTGPKGDFDAAAGRTREAQALYVIYIPGATTASTGLSTTPQVGAPWLMFPGTPKAHIMFTPTM
jgi:hypothetical protein